MKENKNSATEWLIFSVLCVILPVIFAFILSSIINHKIINLSEIIDSIILAVFSIACNLLSICWNVHKQKSECFTKVCFWIAGFVILVSWTTYVVSITNNKICIKQFCFCSLIIAIICCILGIILGIKGDKNNNDILHLMHNNCKKIRTILIKDEHNEKLEPHVIRNYDLLCHPSEFDRVNTVLNNLKCEVCENDK